MIINILCTKGGGKGHLKFCRWNFLLSEKSLFYNKTDNSTNNLGNIFWGNIFKNFTVESRGS